MCIGDLMKAAHLPVFLTGEHVEIVFSAEHDVIINDLNC